jgi:hypothetical protein
MFGLCAAYIGHGRVEVGQHLRIRRLGDNILENRVDVGDLARIARAREELRRDREIAESREAPTDIGDVLVHPPDLGDHENRRKIAPGRGHGAIRDHGAVLGRNLHLAGGEPVRRRGNRLCRYREHGDGEARAERSHEKATAADLPRRHEAVEMRIDMQRHWILR